LQFSFWNRLASATSTDRKKSERKEKKKINVKRFREKKRELCNEVININFALV
jgi:hypothetical protein